MPAQKWTAEQKAEALRIYQESGPAEAERQTGVPGATITSWARRSGLQTDAPANTARATEMAKLSRAAKKAQLAESLLDVALRLKEQIFAPHLAYSFGGKDNDYNDHEIPEPSAQDKRSLLQAIGLAVSNSNLLAGEATSRPEQRVSPEEMEKVLSEFIPDPESRKRLALRVVPGGSGELGEVASS